MGDIWLRRLRCVLYIAAKESHCSAHERATLLANVTMHSMNRDVGEDGLDLWATGKWNAVKRTNENSSNYLL